MRLVPVMLSLALLGGCLAETDASEVEALEAELEDSKPPDKPACETPPCTHDLAYYRQHPEAWLTPTVTRHHVTYDFDWLTCTAEECGNLDEAGWALASELAAAALNLQQVSTTANSVDELLLEATYMMGDCYFEWSGPCEPERVPALTSAVKAFNEGHTSVLGDSCGLALGECSSGTIQCGEGGLACTGKGPLAEEICGNRLDDDCNGLTDDTCGCVPEIPANGVDDDCDGTLDEVLAKIIYVNGQGGTFQHGKDSSVNNLSSVVDVSANVPAFSGGAEAFRQIMACVANAYAAFDVVITDVDPSPLPHVEVVVGGLGSDAGTSDQAGGMAAPTCAPTGDAVVFVFSELYGQDFTEVCNTIAHEVGHAYGLDHEVVAQDLMSYAFVSDKSFQDTDSDCGETTGARPCMCERQKQNSHAHLLSLLSPRSQPEGVPAPEAEGPAALHESVEHVNGATPLRSSVQAAGVSQRLGICMTPH